MRLVFFILFLVTFTARAELKRGGFEGVRPTGMGDAFTALADDANALFYNPAGLTQIKNVHFNLFDFMLGADSDRTLTRLNNALFKSDFEHLLNSSKQYLRLGFKPTFIVPNFGFSFYQDASGYFDIGNPTVDGIDVSAKSDLGAVVGGALPLGEMFSLGASAKVFQRTGLEMTMTTEEILNNPAILNSILQGTSYNLFTDASRHGWAMALSVGAIARIPLMEKGKNAPRLTASAVVDNLGGTPFRELGSNRVPESIKQTVTFGLAYQSILNKNWVWNAVADMRDALVAQPFLRAFHLGTEFRHKVFGLRGGISQGYLTAGFSIEFPPHTRIHFSTHSKELGSGIREREHRWYLLQFIIGFNPI